MAKNNKRSKRKGAKRGLVKPAELPSSEIMCPPGYIRRFIRACRFETDTYTTVLCDDLAITTNGSGLIQTVIADDVTVTTNWSSFASAFDEVRVLAMVVKFCPLWGTGGASAIFWAPIACAVDLDSSTAMTSYDLTNQYSSAREYPGQKEFSIEAIMSSTIEANFQGTGGPSPSKWVKFYSSGNTVSTTVGRVQRSLVVQFRGKGI